MVAVLIGVCVPLQVNVAAGVAPWRAVANAAYWGELLHLMIIADHRAGGECR